MVISPNLKNLEFYKSDGVKYFELVAEEIEHEILDGVFIKAYGYNGSTPGPTIIVSEGDNVVIRVRNNLKEATSVHWHGLEVPNSMDGVPDVQPTPLIKPGEYFDYEFKIKNPAGTYMYHSHTNSINQNFKGLVGGLIIEKQKNSRKCHVDRDYFLMLQEFELIGMEMMKIMPGIYDIDIMAHDFHFLTINGKCYPNVEDLLCKKGESIRIRFGNLLMNHHPIHLHGHQFRVVASDGYAIKRNNQLLKNTILVASGETWDVEFKANNPGVWPLHCHMPHHMSNNMMSKMGGMTTILKYIE